MTPEIPYHKQINTFTLIQSGGGTGPMKPGNRLKGMVPNPAGGSWQMRGDSISALLYEGFFNCIFWGRVVNDGEAVQYSIQ
jgi:hypothetical protein